MESSHNSESDKYEPRCQRIFSSPVDEQEQVRVFSTLSVDIAPHLMGCPECSALYKKLRANYSDVIPDIITAFLEKDVREILRKAEQRSLFEASLGPDPYQELQDEVNALIPALYEVFEEDDDLYRELAVIVGQEETLRHNSHRERMDAVASYLDTLMLLLRDYLNHNIKETFSSDEDSYEYIDAPNIRDDIEQALNPRRARAIKAARFLESEAFRKKLLEHYKEASFNANNRLCFENHLVLCEAYKLFWKAMIPRDFQERFGRIWKRIFLVEKEKSDRQD